MCSNLLCLPPSLVEYLYFVILLIANVLNCLVGLAHVCILARRHWPCAAASPARPMEAVPISVIVPCYLPNEQTIIVATVEHIMLRLEWPGPVTLHVVYNTPAPLPFEATLQALDGREYAAGRVVRVVRADGSTSKAANLNLVLSRLRDEFVALYDADHRPDPSSLRLLMRRLLDTNACAVQGSTYIRNTRGRHVSPLARAIDAEFFVTHFVYFPAMEVRRRMPHSRLTRASTHATRHTPHARHAHATRTPCAGPLLSAGAGVPPFACGQMLASSGYFGGSNALWRTSTLASYAFDTSMLTEDVDVSARRAARPPSPSSPDPV